MVLNECMTYYYVYETTNLINGKKYIGWHQTAHLADGYLGSGKRLHLAIKKYGSESFQKKILGFFDSATAAKGYERLLITEEIIESDDYYNLMPGGTGGDGKGKHSRNYGILKSTEHKKKLSEARKERCTGNSNSFYGKTHSDENRKFMSARQKGELSPVYDTKIYYFTNHLTTETFSGTQYQFRKAYRLDSGNVNRLIKAKIQSYRGWTLNGNSIPRRGRLPDEAIYKITNNYEIFSGTRKQIMKKLQTKDVSRLLTGKNNQCKGWVLYGK